VRLFVSLELPDDHRDALAAVCESGKRSGVRWVPAENVHLTLKFLGEVDEDLIPDLKSALAGVADGAKPFEISLAGSGCFPNPRTPAVIWLGVEAGTDEAVKLAAAVDEAVVPLGFKAEKRPFKPHLTIGRTRNTREGRDTITIKSKQLKDFAATAGRAEALALMKSTLTPDGAIYEEIARFPLGGD
jgi:2'-5' RNA ligase